MRAFKKTLALRRPWDNWLILFVFAPLDYLTAPSGALCYPLCQCACLLLGACMRMHVANFDKTLWDPTDIDMLRPPLGVDCLTRPSISTKIDGRIVGTSVFSLHMIGWLKIEKKTEVKDLFHCFHPSHRFSVTLD